MAWLHAFVDVPAGRLARAADFWGSALGWPAGEPWPGHEEFRSFQPVDGTPYVHLQEIGGPARVHLDVESSDPDATVARAREHGASYVGDHGGWQALRSPGGLPFCVCGTGREQLPEPVTWPDGHRSRLVQLCIDSPVSAHDREVAFWRAFLGGRWVDGSLPELVGKWHDDEGSPLQLLFQRLEEPEGEVRAHLDHGTDDVGAEVARLLDLGAEDLGRGHGDWHVLRDPAGRLFCVTGNDPGHPVTRDLG